MSRFATYLSFVRFSHSVFALPFALTGALLAWRTEPFSWAQIGWIVACMVSARSAAMGFNRAVDARFDALNPRTAMREIPRGAMSLREASAFVAVSSAVFVFAATRLGWWLRRAVAGGAGDRVLVFPRQALHVLHAALSRPRDGGGAVGGWMAAGGGAGPVPWLLGLAIGLWVGGFDVLYACQDVDFDRGHGLRSIPARFGVAAAITISRVMHVGTVGAMAALGAAAGLPALYFGGVAVVAALLVYEQSLVSASDLSQVKRAFDLNGYVGIVYLASTALALYVG
jgi:4-hydroxybenzoate polyprenyltransferase